MFREFTLIKRTIVVYKAKSFQIFFMGFCAATLFLRTHVHPVTPNDGQEIAGFTFFGLLVILFNGIAEMSMAVSDIRLVLWQAEIYSIMHITVLSPSHESVAVHYAAGKAFAIHGVDICLYSAGAISNSQLPTLYTDAGLQRLHSAAPTCRLTSYLSVHIPW